MPLGIGENSYSGYRAVGATTAEELMARMNARIAAEEEAKRVRRAAAAAAAASAATAQTQPPTQAGMPPVQSAVASPVADPTASQFNINPAPQGPQSDIYGAVPGATMVPDVVGDIQRSYPQLAETNQAIGQNILSKLKGELSPEVIANLQNDAARFGVQSGMPGSGLQTNQRLLGNIRTTEALQNQGIQDYLRFAPTVSATQTVRPETQIGLAQTNAMLSAAPDPTAAGGYAEGLFNKYLDRLSASGISPAAGTGLFPQAAASFPGLMPQQPLVSRFTARGGYQQNQQPQSQSAAAPAPVSSPAGGYWTPDNFSELTPAQQTDYWTQLNRFSYLNPADYE